MPGPVQGLWPDFRDWSCREERFQEISHRADRAALEYLQAWAGVTRTGYHGVRVDGQEPGRFAEAGLVVTSWLQGTSRDGDPQDHVHNQVARITRTVRDGKWRALDTASLRAVLGALQGVAATAVAQLRERVQDAHQQATRSGLRLDQAAAVRAAAVASRGSAFHAAKRVPGRRRPARP